MDTYIFARNINGTEAEGIINTKTQMVLCLCTEENSKMILQAIKITFEVETGNLHKPLVSGWVATTDKLPKSLQTVWVCNGKGWIALGCLVETNEGWHWAESNGVIYIENGEIVAECESDDLDVVYWHELPKPLATNGSQLAEVRDYGEQIFNLTTKL